MAACGWRMSAFSSTKKLMSVSRAEFDSSLARLPDVRMDGPDAWLVTIAGVVARVTFEIAPGVRLGGLLDLPRAHVCIEFKDHNDPVAARTEFFRQFELVFQRGGG
jgi:hypothetical protein